MRKPADRPGTDVLLGAVIADPGLRSRLVEALDSSGIEIAADRPTVEALAGADLGLEVVVVYENQSRDALFEAVAAAKTAFPDRPIVAISSLAEARHARGALRAGADGIVSESELSTTLVPTIRAVGTGLICIPRPMRSPLQSESLSAREKQILGMLVMGFTNAEIASRLFLAESTVKSHLSSAYTKLGVRSRKDAASMILDPSEGLGPGILAISAA